MKNSGRKTVKVAAASKVGKVGSSGSVAGGTRVSAPTHEQIAMRSYTLYLARGGVHGFDVEDWLQAEAELTRDSLIS